MLTWKGPDRSMPHWEKYQMLAIRVNSVGVRSIFREDFWQDFHLYTSVMTSLLIMGQ